MNVYQERESENMNHMNKQLYRLGTICPSAHLSTQKYGRSDKQRLHVVFKVETEITSLTFCKLLNDSSRSAIDVNKWNTNDGFQIILLITQFILQQVITMEFCQKRKSRHIKPVVLFSLGNKSQC